MKVNLRKYVDCTYTRGGKTGKTFFKSHYEARKKEKNNKTNITKLMLVMSTLDRSNMESQAEIFSLQIKDLSSTLRSLYKELSQLELNQMDIGQKVRRSQ